MRKMLDNVLYLLATSWAIILCTTWIMAASIGGVALIACIIVGRLPILLEVFGVIIAIVLIILEIIELVIDKTWVRDIKNILKEMKEAKENYYK